MNDAPKSPTGSQSAGLTCYAILVAVEYPDGQQIADDLIKSGESVMSAGAHPAHLLGIANIVKNSHLFRRVITDQSNAHFFEGLDVELEINKRDVLLAA